MKKVIAGLSFVLLGLIVASSQSYAQDHHDDQNQGQRYYDRAHKDYHNWNSDEDRNYHQYLNDNHKTDHDWKKASKKEQNQYWDWRHQHQDSH